MLRACLLFIVVLTLSSCAERGSIQVVETNCAYSSFLKANNAELSQDFHKALKWYKAAYSCDPHSHYLQSKIPLMYIRMEDFATAQRWLEENISHTNEDKNLTVLLARLYSEEGLNDQAIELYKNILTIDRDPDILLQLGSLYHNLGLYTNAEQTFSEVLQIDKASYPAHLLLARTLTADNQLKRAEHYYQKALELNWSIPLAYEIAAFYSETGNHEKSLFTYKEILKIQQDDEFAFSLKLTELIRLKKINEAIKEVNEQRSYTQNPEQLDNVVVQALFENGTPEAAIPLLKEMAKRYANTRATYTLALIYYDKKEYSKALYWLDQSSVIDEFYEPRLQLEVDIYLKQNEDDKAIALLEKDITRTGGSPPHYKLLAALFLRKENTRSAEKTYLQGLQEFPADASLSYAYALLLDRQKRHEESITIMQAVLNEDPDNAEALNFIGYTWASSNTNLLTALEYTSRAAKLMPENGYIRDSVGWCYYKLGMYDKALEHLIAANILASDDPNILQHLGDAYLALELIREARKSYEQALFMYHKLGLHDKVKTIQKKLNNLTSSSKSLSYLEKS